MQPKDFRHKIKGQVKFDEVDSFGVVHNVKYFGWLEWARIKYLEAAGYPVSSDTFSKENLLMVVHQEIDYAKPLRFFDFYTIYTKTSKIGKSSIRVANIICDEAGDKVLTAEVVMVHIDEKTMQSKDIPETIVSQIKDYEKGGRPDAG